MRSADYAQGVHRGRAHRDTSQHHAPRPQAGGRPPHHTACYNGCRSAGRTCASRAASDVGAACTAERASCEGLHRSSSSFSSASPRRAAAGMVGIGRMFRFGRWQRLLSNAAPHFAAHPPGGPVQRAEAETASTRKTPTQPAGEQIDQLVSQAEHLRNVEAVPACSISGWAMHRHASVTNLCFTQVPSMRLQCTCTQELSSEAG